LTITLIGNNASNLLDEAVSFAEQFKAQLCNYQGTHQDPVRRHLPKNNLNPRQDNDLRLALINQKA
jgi:hypothetical protein